MASGTSLTSTAYWWGNTSCQTPSPSRTCCMRASATLGRTISYGWSRFSDLAAPHQGLTRSRSAGRAGVQGSEHVRLVFQLLEGAPPGPDALALCMQGPGFQNLRVLWGLRQHLRACLLGSDRSEHAGQPGRIGGCRPGAASAAFNCAGPVSRPAEVCNTSRVWISGVWARSCTRKGS